MNHRKAKVLIIEDDPDILEVLTYNLEREGFQVATARDGESGLRQCTAWKPELVLLDLMLPSINGLEVCRVLRQQESTQHIPVIMLTAKGEESDKVLGLGLGADDYVTKPFGVKELVARIQAVLRRGQTTGKKKSHIEVGPLSIDMPRHQIHLRGKALKFTIAEFRILQTLASQPGRVFTREQILDKINHGESFVIDRNVDVHIGAIRKKFTSDSKLIQTVRGVGYKFQEAHG